MPSSVIHLIQKHACFDSNYIKSNMIQTSFSCLLMAFLYFVSSECTQALIKAGKVFKVRYFHQNMKIFVFV